MRDTARWTSRLSPLATINDTQLADDVESAGVGESFDPNDADTTSLHKQIARLLADRDLRVRTQALGREVGATSGPDRAADVIQHLAARVQGLPVTG